MENSKLSDYSNDDLLEVFSITLHSIEEWDSLLSNISWGSYNENEQAWKDYLKEEQAYLEEVRAEILKRMR